MRDRADGRGRSKCLQTGVRFGLVQVVIAWPEITGMRERNSFGRVATVLETNFPFASSVAIGRLGGLSPIDIVYAHWNRLSGFDRDVRNVRAGPSTSSK